MPVTDGRTKLIEREPTRRISQKEEKWWEKKNKNVET